MKTDWKLKVQPEAAEIERVVSDWALEPAIWRLLLQRGISTRSEAEQFLKPSLNQLHDPFLMKDMDLAVSRLISALHSGERILVFGDYDVDGTTAVALVYSFLSFIEANCDFYIPDRFTEGYGFSEKGVHWAAENGFQLIITLDCGIKDGARIELANSLGMEVIVCDHHNPDAIPPALAVLDPKRPDCPYPDKGLSGCGVGFKLLQGYCQATQTAMDFLFRQLDLLSISIGADIVPLVGENRALAFEGLKVLQQFPRPGITEMLNLAGFKRPNLTISDVVFILAPRINAAGRIMSGRNAVRLLISNDPAEAAEYGKLLEANNTTRKGLDKDITVSAIQMVEEDAFYNDSFSTVIRGEDWSKGVIGIVASRLVETYYKPAIVLTRKEGTLAGSARSISGIDLYSILGECSDLLIQFGGHTMAAGLSMKEEHFLDFRLKFDRLVAQALQHERPVPTIEIDAEVDFSEITPRFFSQLQRFAPFGPDNMRPVFLSRRLQDAGKTRQVGETKAHLKLHLKQASNALAFDGIAFDKGMDWGPVIKSGTPVDLLYSLEPNEWNGKISIQLMAADIRESEPNPIHSVKESNVLTA